MALTAVRECSVVDIVFLVAEGAILAHAFKSSPVFVAFGATQCLVNAVEREVLMEVLRLFPGGFVMAFRAGSSEFPSMHVFVAADATLALDLREKKFMDRLMVFDVL